MSKAWAIVLVLSFAIAYDAGLGVGFFAFLFLAFLATLFHNYG